MRESVAKSLPPSASPGKRGKGLCRKVANHYLCAKDQREGIMEKRSKYSLRRGRSGLGAGVLALCLLAACSDDEGSGFQPTLPATTGSNVVTIEHLGSVSSSYDWQLTYQNGRLTKAYGILRDEDSELDKSFYYTSKLSYSRRAVSVTNTSDEDVSLSLNSSGYIEEMTVDRNIYEFSYTNGRLTGWEKTVFESSFGQATQYVSSATLTYSDGNLKTISYSGADGEEALLTFTSTQIQNVNGLLPVAVEQELGCLGFEHLYYAGLLGKATTNLVASVAYTFENDSTQNYTMEFEYSTRGGDVVLCSYHNQDGLVASVSYTY